MIWNRPPRRTVPHGFHAPIDTSQAHSARIWNYWLGGKDNHPVDREAGDGIVAVLPEIVDIAVATRAVLARMVTHLVEEAGIDQFLDIGTGLPTANNTHEVAQTANPAARVVYVDNDPLVLTHARALLTGTPERITALFDGLKLVEPGVVREMDEFCGLARKR